jgi:hypothetical protein
MPDDIRTDHAVSRTERKPGSGPDAGGAREAGFRYVGPESEVRGGPEAPPTNKNTPSPAQENTSPAGQEKTSPAGQEKTSPAARERQARSAGEGDRVGT